MISGKFLLHLVLSFLVNFIFWAWQLLSLAFLGNIKTWLAPAILIGFAVFAVWRLQDEENRRAYLAGLSASLLLVLIIKGLILVL